MIMVGLNVRRDPSSCKLTFRRSSNLGQGSSSIYSFFRKERCCLSSKNGFHTSQGARNESNAVALPTLNALLQVLLAILV